jgi:putative two-component system response regulator
MTDRKAFSILVVDDDPDFVHLATTAFANAGYTNCTGVVDPTKVSDGLGELRPDLIVLDLNMPKISGCDLLRKWRTHQSEVELLPVIAMTADQSGSLRRQALELGASDFITKNGDMEEMLLRANNLLRMRELFLEVRGHAASLEDQVRRRTEDVIRAQMALVDRLGIAVEARDSGETLRHSDRVGTVAAMIAEKLKLPQPEISVLRRAAPLHDIGKIGVPDSILNKTGKLTPDEFEVVKSHSIIGHRILSGTGVPLLETAAEIAIGHHENWDGSGYPHGLEKTDTPLPARIAALADVYEALTSERSYKQAWSHEQAVEQIRDYRGSKFDPDVVDAFMEFAEHSPFECNTGTN